MTEPDLFLKYGISLAIGILMGMQREFATRPDGPEQSAGVRTFALTGLWGCLAAHISDIAGSALPLAACLAVLGAFLTAMFFVENKDGKRGLTTVVAMLDIDVGLKVWLPLAASMMAGLRYCSLLFRQHGTNAGTDKTPFPIPFELGPALKFGRLFIQILSASRVVQYF